MILGGARRGLVVTVGVAGTVADHGRGCGGAARSGVVGGAGRGGAPRCGGRRGRGVGCRGQAFGWEASAARGGVSGDGVVPVRRGRLHRGRDQGHGLVVVVGVLGYVIKAAASADLDPDRVSFTAGPAPRPPYRSAKTELPAGGQARPGSSFRWVRLGWGGPGLATAGEKSQSRVTAKRPLGPLTLLMLATEITGWCGVAPWWHSPAAAGNQGARGARTCPHPSVAELVDEHIRIVEAANR